MNIIIIILLSIVISFSSSAQDVMWKIELKGGIPVHVGLPLTIQQNGYSEIKINSAHFYSEPLVMPYVWSMRLGYWKNNLAWEFESMHLKLYLDNKPEEIQHFAVTHGYNLQMINHAWLKDNSFIYRLGAGVTLVHPENTIREKRFDESKGINNSGYYIGGMVVQGSIQKDFTIIKNLLFSTEIKILPSYSIIPVADGKAYLWNLCFDFGFGFSYCFRKNNSKE